MCAKMNEEKIDEYDSLLDLRALRSLRTLEYVKMTYLGKIHAPDFFFVTIIVVDFKKWSTDLFDDIALDMYLNPICFNLYKLLGELFTHVLGFEC